MVDLDWRELDKIRHATAPAPIQEVSPKDWDELIAELQKSRDTGESFLFLDGELIATLSRPLLRTFVQHYDETVEAANRAIRKANRWREESLKRNPKIKPLECRYHGALEEIERLKKELERVTRLAEEKAQMMEKGFAAAMESRAKREGGEE
jgi:lysyl-tRNA synthetase class I